MITFSYTILYVRDVNVSIEFYEKAFGFKRTFVKPGGEYGELSTGSTTLSFASFEQAATNLPNGFIESDLRQKSFGIEIGFCTKEVQKVYDHAVACGAIAEAEPQLKSYGQTVAYVRDLDGFLVEICTPMS